MIDNRVLQSVVLLASGLGARQTIHWTLGGFALLLRTCFGSKFVLEILLW